MKKMKTLPVKGLRTPRWLIYLKGAYHGRIRKTAALNQESGLLDSAYVSEKLFLYNKACADHMVSLERELSSSRLEAATILKTFEIEELYNKMPAAGIDEPMKPEEESIPAWTSRIPVTAEEAKAARARAKQMEESERRKAEAKAIREKEIKKIHESRDLYKKRKEENIVRLTEIREKIISRELIAQERLSATSEAVKSLLCSYAHGAMKRPVNSRYIPEIEFVSFMDGYYAAHEELNREIDKTLELKEATVETDE